MHAAVVAVIRMEIKMRSILLIYLGICALIDIKTRKIPAYFMLAGVAVAVTYFAVMVCTHQRNAVELLMAVLPAAALYSLSLAGGCLGKGDIIVFLIIGLCLPRKENLGIYCFSFLLAAIGSAILLICKKGTGKTRIPFIPYIFAASCIGMYIF